MSVTDTLLLRSLLWFLMFGSIAGLLVGAALILRPDWLLRVSKRANRWVSTRRLDRALEQSINLDHWFYRYRLVSGILTLAGAVYIIYFFTAAYDKPSALAGLSKHYTIPPALMDALLDALVLSSLAGAVFALIVSLFLLFRPSMLRGFEHGANQWVSLRSALKPLEVARSGVDEYVFRHVRLVGVLLLFGSLYTLVGMVTWLS